MKPIHDLATLLRTMQPARQPGTYVYATLPVSLQLPRDMVVASIREPEGLSVILEESVAREHGVTPLFRCAWIMLTVNSALDAVGLTAAFATALASAGISCNVVAGAQHDHLFVPLDCADRAVDVLSTLSANAMGSTTP